MRKRGKTVSRFAQLHQQWVLKRKLPALPALNDVSWDGVPLPGLHKKGTRDIVNHFFRRISARRKARIHWVREAESRGTWLVWRRTDLHLRHHSYLSSGRLAWPFSRRSLSSNI